MVVLHKVDIEVHVSLLDLALSQIVSVYSGHSLAVYEPCLPSQLTDIQAALGRQNLPETDCPIKLSVFRLSFLLENVKRRTARAATSACSISLRMVEASCQGAEYSS